MSQHEQGLLFFEIVHLSDGGFMYPFDTIVLSNLW